MSMGRYSADRRPIHLGSSGSTPSLGFNNLSVGPTFVAYAHKSSVLVYPTSSIDSGAPKVVKAPYRDPAPVIQVQWCATKSGEVLVVATTEGVHFWNSTLDTLLHNTPLSSVLSSKDVEGACCRGIAAVPEVGRVFVGVSSGDIMCFDVKDTSVTLASTTSCHRDPVSCLSASGTRLVSADDSGEISLWDAETMTRTTRFPETGEPCTSVASRRGYIVAGFTSGHLRIFDVASGSMAVEVTAHTRAITSIALHPDDDVFVSVGEDARLSVWGLPQYASSAGYKTELLRTAVTEDQVLTGVAFVPALANAILACSYDTTVMSLFPST